MPEHAHLVVRPHTGGAGVSSILKAIKQPVGQRAIAYVESHAPEWLPKLTRTRGGAVERLFWQSGGGYDRNITEPGTLAAAIAYIHENPVRRGLAARASDWMWSSAGWFEAAGSNGLRPDPVPLEWVE